MSILDKIKEANLVGRGGASFPTAVKWEAVKNAPGDKKFVICNFSEGEPGVKKDHYILEHYPEKVIDGIKLAMEFLNADKGYVYINPEYHKEFFEKLSELTKETKIEIFKKPHEAGYVGGEESTALNVIEGTRAEPRLRPPFPVTKGLWGCPTLINNVETFFNVSLVNSGDYKKMRFYTISGEAQKKGVYEFPEDYAIERVLKETGNFPDFSFFVQVGGDGSGEVLSDQQLAKLAGGAGSITIHKPGKKKPKELMEDWINFFYSESCGQCTTCREGTYRLKEILASNKPNWTMFLDLLKNLKETAFCGLGSVVPVPIFSYIENVLIINEQTDEEVKNLVEAYKKFKI